MKKLSTIFGLRKEAILLDSKLYIFKTILAIGTGYFLGKILPITRLDMISVLLGIMYNLEPINIVGVKGGINQLIASTLGAVCTGILIMLFGINIFTISIAMALTIYVSLKINWRMVSPVAIFTCIYMIQNIQKTSAGVPSIWLTFRLRIVALGVGVIIAIFYNYVFSFFYYRKIADKRLQFAKIQLLNGLNYTEKLLSNPSEIKSRNYIAIFPAIFDDLDLAYSNIDIMLNESRYSVNLLKTDKLKTLQKILQYFRDINHLSYDINFIACRDENFKELNEASLNSIRNSISALRDMNFVGNREEIDNSNIEIQEYKADCNGRICSNISMIKGCVELVVEEIKKL